SVGKQAAVSGKVRSPIDCRYVVSGETIDELMPFYRDLLGFRLTDYYHEPFEARFLHVNPRHHSLAFIKTGHSGVHHIMMEVFSFDDIGQAYDIALGEGRVATTLGRHTSDFITSFYSRTPSEERDEVAPSNHSITSSAVASKVAGTVMPSNFAVCRLMMNSNLAGRITGRSAGLSPLRIRPV